MKESMIELKLRITENQVSKFEQAIEDLYTSKPDKNIDPIIYQAEINGCTSMLEDLEQQRDDYKQQLGL